MFIYIYAKSNSLYSMWLPQSDCQECKPHTPSPKGLAQRQLGANTWWWLVVSFFNIPIQWYQRWKFGEKWEEWKIHISLQFRSSWTNLATKLPVARATHRNRAASLLWWRRDVRPSNATRIQRGISGLWKFEVRAQLKTLEKQVAPQTKVGCTRWIKMTCWFLWYPCPKLCLPALKLLDTWDLRLMYFNLGDPLFILFRHWMEQQHTSPKRLRLIEHSQFIDGIYIYN